MSESQQRVARRELRRAIGAQALTVIDTHTKLLTHDIPQALGALKATVQRDRHDIQKLNDAVDELTDAVTALHTPQPPWWQRWWQRWRWF